MRYAVNAGERARRVLNREQERLRLLAFEEVLPPREFAGVPDNSGNPGRGGRDCFRKVAIGALLFLGNVVSNLLQSGAVAVSKDNLFLNFGTPRIIGRSGRTASNSDRPV